MEKTNKQFSSKLKANFLVNEMPFFFEEKSIFSKGKGNFSSEEKIPFFRKCFTQCVCIAVWIFKWGHGLVGYLIRLYLETQFFIKQNIFVGDMSGKSLGKCQ